MGATPGQEQVAAGAVPGGPAPGEFLAALMGGLPRKSLDLTPLPPSLNEYKPTFRDRIARSMMGDEPPSPERRGFVSGLMGSTGLGTTGVGLVDATPAGIPLAVNDAGKRGNFQEAAFAAMPATRLGGPVAAAEREVLRAYQNAPDGLMGFSRNGPQKAFEDTNYKHVQHVRVTFPDTGDVFEDAIKGLNGPHALERARRNWPGALIDPISGK